MNQRKRPGGDDGLGPKPPDAMTATHCSVIFIIGAAMQNAARLAAVS